MKQMERSAFLGLALAMFLTIGCASSPADIDSGTDASEDAVDDAPRDIATDPLDASDAAPDADPGTPPFDADELSMDAEGSDAPEDAIADTPRDLAADPLDAPDAAPDADPGTPPADADDLSMDAEGTDAPEDAIADTPRDLAADPLDAPDAAPDADPGTPPADADDLPVDAEGTDAPDVPTPPLWTNIAPVGVNTIGNTIGISTHMNQRPGQDPRRDFEFEKYQELGAPILREDYHWERIEPSDDQWDLDAVQGQVDQAMATGIKILPMLAYQVDWAMTAPGNYSTIAWAEYGEYVGKVAGAYCGHIKEYEIWNEQNIPRFWAPKPDPEAYGNLLKAAYGAIKSACPDARVAFGGMSSYDVETDVADRFGFLLRVWQAHPDICNYFDILAYHPYTFFQYYPPERDEIVDATLSNEGQSAQTVIVRDYLAEMGCPDKGLWITEQGWPSYDLTEEQTGQFLPRSLLLAARDDVEKWFWYTFWDGYPTTEGIRPHEDYFGLFGWTGEDGSVRRAKPTWLSLKAAADLLGDKTFARDISAALGLPNDVYALVFMSQAGAMTVAAWDGRDFPDVSWGIEGPGGPDTSFDATIPLPHGVTGATVYDLKGTRITDGIVVEEEGGIVRLTLRLTPSVTYISLTAPE